MRLSDFKWYWRWKGGIWSQIEWYELRPYVCYSWYRIGPETVISRGRIVATEDYATLKPRRGIGDLFANACDLGIAPRQLTNGHHVPRSIPSGPPAPPPADR